MATDLAKVICIVHMHNLMYMSSIGVSSVHVSSIGVSSVHVSSIGVSSVHVSSIGVSSVHVSSIGVSSVHVSSVHVSSIHVSSVHVTHIMLVCTVCACLCVDTSIGSKVGHINTSMYTRSKLHVFVIHQCCYTCVTALVQCCYVMRYISINIEVSDILSSGTEGAGCVDGHDCDTPTW